MDVALGKQIYTKKSQAINAKPFLKWAGGKTQILSELELRLPLHIKKSGIIDKYVEPFIGGGAFFFLLKRDYQIKKSYLVDVNKELVIGYKVIQKDPLKLIEKLRILEDKFLILPSEKRKNLFYEIRTLYNNQIPGFDYENYNNDWSERGTLLIFLNKTCFNGLFRQNSKGEFNVPYGNYENPNICDEVNIIEVSKALKKTEIIQADFEISGKFIKENTFVYLDPPYRPLNKTSSFTSYAKENFDDNDQKRLADFVKLMSNKGAYLILSNSDPKNQNPDDDFFDDLYKDFYIDRVFASRMINSNGKKRVVYLQEADSLCADIVIFDPPYSPRQVAECYKQVGRKTTQKDTQSRFWGDCKKEIARITKLGGIVISCGWNSNGIGKGLGFAITDGRLVAHGGNHNDTIVTIERKVN